MIDPSAFSHAVDDGLRLSRRLITGKPAAAAVSAAPPKAPTMDRSSTAPVPKLRFFLPTAPMVYAVIDNPAIVDNPDIPSYQPYVYGQLDPPALIPLQMSEVAVEVEAGTEMAIVSLRARWRVHCVTRTRCCDCRFVLPIREQGSILGVNIEVGKRSYSTQVIKQGEDKKNDNFANGEAGGFLRPQLFYLSIPQVNGGSDICISATWSQRIVYSGCQFSITIPFHFPDYVNPWVKHLPKKQKIQLNVNTGISKKFVVQKISHPLKEKKCHEGKLSLLYEANVESWSTTDFHLSCVVESSDLFGGIILQSPTIYDDDQRDMFCLYLFPGNEQNTKVFRKEVVFVVDISGSMLGKPLENVKNALSAALLDLNQEDSFDIIAFNDEVHRFSANMQPATSDMIENANQWITENFIAGGGTNILQPLNEAISLLSSTQDAISYIFLVTDGSVEDERSICNNIRSLTNQESITPRISTFGIGSYCNHYFLKKLASLGRGHFDASYDIDSIETQMQEWFQRASSSILANITVDIFKSPDEFEVHPFPIPDLSVACPVFVTGRYEGKFPGLIKAKGILADMSDMYIDLKVENTKDFIPEKAFAKQQIDLLTTQAWFSESKVIEEKVIRLSTQCNIQSEYTLMVMSISEKEPQAAKQAEKDTVKMHASTKKQLPARIRSTAAGFGDIAATKENLPVGFGDKKLPDTFDAYVTRAAGCCGRLTDCCCCMCFIKACSKMNDQCVIVLTQLCTVMSCFACSECCSLCCGDSEN